jgi:VanZ family protein
MPYLYKFIAFVILAVFTLAVAVFIGRFEEINSELLINPGFDDGLSRWEQAGGYGTIAIDDQKTVTIHSSDSSHVVSLTQSITCPTTSKLMKLSADIKVADIVPGGPSDGFNARLSLIGIDSNGQRLPFDARVTALLGSHHWKRYSRVFNLPADTEKVEISAQLLYATGTMWIKKVSLKEVFEKPAFPYLMSSSIMLWTIFLVWLLYPVILGCRGIVLQWIVSLMIVSVLLGTLISGSIFDQYHKDAVTGFEKMSIQGTASEDPRQSGKTETNEIISKVLPYSKKIGHFILFGILGIIFPLVSPQKGKAQLLLIIAMLAGATEFLQFFVEGRSPSFLDWVIDMAGAVFGFLLIYLVNQIRQMKQML